MTFMRAKVRVTKVESYLNSEVPGEIVHFVAVGPGKYPEDGSDENNTFAKFTPLLELKMAINNPKLLGEMMEGDTFYLDFVECEE